MHKCMSIFLKRIKTKNISLLSSVFPFALLLVFLAAGCGGGSSGSGSNPVTLETIAVTPAISSIPAGLTQQMTAMGTYSDGTSEDITTTVTWDSDTPATASIDGSGLANGVSAGTATIIAILDTVSGNTGITVTDAVLETIAVTPSGTSIPLGLTQQMTAMGTYSDGTTKDITTTVTWNSDTPATASIDGSGLANGIDIGTVTITATLDTVSSNTGITVTAAVLETIAVTPAISSIPAGLTQQMTAMGTFSDGISQDITSMVTWETTPSISIMVGTGTVKGMAVGTATVTATLYAVFGNATLEISAAVLETIAVTPVNPSIPIGLTQQMTATGYYSDGTSQDITPTVTWSSNTTAAATVTGTGIVNSVATGSPIITAASGDISGQVTVHTTPAVLQSITVLQANLSIPVGLTRQMDAWGNDSDGGTRDLTATVVWSSDNTSVATVTGSGLVSAVSAGTAHIIATSGSISGNTAMTVTSATLQIITIAPVNPSVPVGLTQQMTVTGTYSDWTVQDISQIVTWASDTTPVATVTNTGLATGVAAGTAKITATADAVSNYTTLTITPVTISVVIPYMPNYTDCFRATPTSTSYTVCFPHPTFLTGSSYGLTASALYADATTQNVTSATTWSSATTTVATFNTTNKNVIQTHISGTSDITAWTVSGSTTITLTVKTRNYHSDFVCTNRDWGGNCTSWYYNNYFTYD